MRLHRNVSGIINYNDGQILYAHIFLRFFPLDFQCDMIDDFRKVMIEKQTSHHDMRIVWLREKKKSDQNHDDEYLLGFHIFGAFFFQWNPFVVSKHMEFQFGWKCSMT